MNLNNPMHSCVFAGARTWKELRVNEGDLSGFRSLNPSYFAYLDGTGDFPTYATTTTDDHMVSQFTKEMNFLKRCSPKEMQDLKE